jgi:uncharacterized DUF497 family protein
MQFEWDEAKNHRNLLKHRVRFETAILVFRDPCALTQTDESSSDEDRWITLGLANPTTILFVVHTWRGQGAEEVVRIISARPATPRERKKYEEAHQGTKAGHCRHRGHERRRH